MNIDDILSNLKETAQGCEGGPDDHAFIALSRAQDILRECKAAGFIMEDGRLWTMAGHCLLDTSGKVWHVLVSVDCGKSQESGQWHHGNAMKLFRVVELIPEAARKAGVTMKEKAQ